jgi:hypothetical protein
MKTVLATFISTKKQKMLSAMFAFLVFPVLLTQAQIIGDYRTATNGNWASSATWEVFNGSIWTSSSSYPGQEAGSYAINIQYGHTVSVPNTGIITTAMGPVVINGRLNLNGGNTTVVDFSLNTPQITITPDLITPASIEFIKKCKLILPLDAIIKVWTNGLIGDCNNNQEINIGANTFAVCNGAPGSIFTFAELMAGGGTINAIAVPSASSICLGESVNLTGSHSGAVANAPTYSWSNSGPATLIFSPSSTMQNTTITPTLGGIYTIILTVTTNNEGTFYNNSERITLIVNTKSANPTSVVAGTNYLMLGTSTTLSLQGGGGGSNEVVRWYTSSCGGALVGIGNNLRISPTVETTYYGRYENGVPCNYYSSCVQTTIHIIPFSNIWKGEISCDFGVADNWVNKTIPLNGQHIIFDELPLNNCVLDSNRTIGNITNGSDKFFVTNSHQLSISGCINFTGIGKFDATSAGSTIIFSGSTAQMIPGDIFYNNTINMLNINNTNGSSLIGNLTITQNLLLTNGALNIGVNTFTINGEINKTSGLLIGGISSNIIFGGTGVSTNLPAINVNNLTINRSNGIRLDGSVSIAGTLHLPLGVLSLGSNTIIFSGASPTRIAGVINAGDSLATVIFANTNPIEIPSQLFTGDVYDFTMNAIGGVSIYSDLSISNSLRFLKGLIYTDTNKIILGNLSNEIIGTDIDKYIDGSCCKIGNTSFVFPVGSNGVFAPIGISAAAGGGSATDSFTAKYISSMPHPTFDSTQHDETIARISGMEYWLLERVGTNKVAVTLSWDSRSGEVSDAEELTVAHWNSTTPIWEDKGGNVNTNNQTITTGLISSFSPFTLGSKSRSSNLLPVTFVSFEGNCENDRTFLTWETASETNNNYFEIQKSDDGKNWVFVSIVQGSGNSTQEIKYQYIDNSTESKLTYYRLKQVDFNGNYKYSRVISVSNCSEYFSELEIYPNPTIGMFHWLNNGIQEQIFSIDIFNVLGEKVYSSGGNSSEIDLTSQQNGIYFIHFNMNSKSIVKKIILEK